MPRAARPLIPFHVEQIVSKQHGGTGDPSGLALACDRCNAYKGPNLTSIDPDTLTVAALFNPRTGRILAVIFTFPGDAIRPITAYPAGARLHDLYFRVRGT